MLTYRQGFTKERHKEINIVKGEEFKKSKKTFKCIGNNLKKKRNKKQVLWVIEHYPAIIEQHLETIYYYLTKRLEDANILQSKVISISLKKILFTCKLSHRQIKDLQMNSIYLSISI